jgi:hypothetical protein
MHANLLNIIVSGVTQPPEAPRQIFKGGGAIFRQPTICIGVRDRGVKLPPPQKKAMEIGSNARKNQENSGRFIKICVNMPRTPMSMTI